MRQKVEKYLDTNRDSIPCLKLKHSNSCEDLPDGQLIYELNRLGRIEKEHQ